MPARFPVPVDTRAPHGETNAYVLGRDDALLVDPAGRTPELDTAVGSVDHVAVTHAHPDHVGAVAEYATETDATVWAHAAFADRFERETGVEPDRAFRPGDEIGDTGVTVLDTPGHAPDHVAFVEGREAVVGDLVFAAGSVFVGATDGDLRAYLSSLRRVAVRDFERLHPGHGPPVDAPRERLYNLYFHRRDRDRRVLAAVEDGCATVSDILDHAYDKDLAGVRDLAGQTVRAHLDKLLVEGKVEWDGARAYPVED
ncbi:MBL fold metallo-hydrolase [Halobacterium litoreum]|uniref:MBL fold metallo-hydrolase n=1 Tax=Halobacterium litoreum TaxID=2039234 RepID=A0ABD5NGR7_9EURY|nr:MBL fold metallo-hydrolase [Halobacterium litoreum]UHH12750.1 MBL fold metallo-hydrolase [Halobacterium litoreum]